MRLDRVPLGKSVTLCTSNGLSTWLGDRLETAGAMCRYNTCRLARPATTQMHSSHMPSGRMTLNDQITSSACNFGNLVVSSHTG